MLIGEYININSYYIREINKGGWIRRISWCGIFGFSLS